MRVSYTPIPDTGGDYKIFPSPASSLPGPGWVFSSGKIAATGVVPTRGLPGTDCMRLTYAELTGKIEAVCPPETEDEPLEQR